MSKYSQAPFSRNNISHCLHWKVVISSQWVNSSREPSLCASNSRPPSGTQNELLRRGLNNRPQSGAGDAKKQRCFPVWAHAQTHTQRDTQEQPENISLEESPSYLGPWIGGKGSLLFVPLGLRSTKSFNFCPKGVFISNF